MSNFITIEIYSFYFVKEGGGGRFETKSKNEKSTD